MAEADLQAAAIPGTVTGVLPNATFRVALDDGREVTAVVPGKLRKLARQIAAGDRVSVVLSPAEPTRGRITQRHR